MKVAIAIALLMLAAACSRIETGEVGLRVGFDKQISMTELAPGSFNQTLIGDVLTFPVRDVKVDVNDVRAVTKENTQLADFDASLIYTIAPSAVAELFTTKSRGFHLTHEGDVYLMYDYMTTLLRNAAYKVVRTREALSVVDARTLIEQEMRIAIEDTLKTEKLDGSLRVTQVIVRNIQPNAQIVQSATEVVRAQNELNAKMIEVKTAGEEAKRIAALNSNAKAIDYMNAQANVTIAEAVKAGKVNTIILPYDFKGMVSVK